MALPNEEQHEFITLRLLADMVGDWTRHKVGDWYVMHGINDEDKVASMVKTLGKGETLPPIACKGQVALEGVHRMNAYHRAGMEPVVYQIDEYESLLQRQ